MAVMSDWQGCYSGGWQGEITPEAFAHPAKYARALIRRIYEHMSAEGWLKPGDQVIDPFGGVALGALDAMRLGLNWTGCELEPRFVDLGNRNIELWLERYAGHFPGWGTARLVQGDSRELLQVIGGEYAGMVSSPPYADGAQHTGGDTPTSAEHIKGGKLHLPGISGAVSSPPYAEARIGQESGQEQCGRGDQYGATPGQLGGMKPGDWQASVSSPPFEKVQGFNDKEFSDQWGPKQSRTTDPSGYGSTLGNIGNATGDTFWSSARIIVEQVYLALAPGGHAAWVVKAFVKNKQIVDFPGQWQALCEAVGFQTVHVHRAWLVEHKGTQYDTEGNGHSKVTERKSFFRRLAEKKGSPRIDWETVICMEKP